MILSKLKIKKSSIASNINQFNSIESFLLINKKLDKCYYHTDHYKLVCEYALNIYAGLIVGFIIITNLFRRQKISI